MEFLPECLLENPISIYLLNNKNIYNYLKAPAMQVFINIINEVRVMEDKKIQLEHYLKIIDEIEKVRTMNNINWMDVLRLAFIHAPKDAKELMKKINTADDEISAAVKKLLD